MVAPLSTGGGIYVTGPAPVLLNSRLRRPRADTSLGKIYAHAQTH